MNYLCIFASREARTKFSRTAEHQERLCHRKPLEEGSFVLTVARALACSPCEGVRHTLSLPLCKQTATKF